MFLPRSHPPSDLNLRQAEVSATTFACGFSPSFPPVLQSFSPYSVRLSLLLSREDCEPVRLVVGFVGCARLSEVGQLFLLLHLPSPNPNSPAEPLRTSISHVSDARTKYDQVTNAATVNFKVPRDPPSVTSTPTHAEQAEHAE